MAVKKEPPSCSDADRELFLKMLGDTPTGKPTISVKKPNPPKPANPDDSTLFLDSVGESFEKHPEFFHKQHGLRADKKPKPKSLARHEGPDAVIDLHACTLELALRRTEEFLLRCQLKKFRRVLVIHGKGSGILKEGVRKYLAHHPLVLQVDDAEKQHGGNGAAMVLLKR